MLAAQARILRLPLRRFFTGGADPGLNVTHSSQLRVMHTNQWPIPYYQRYNITPRTLYPEGDYNIRINSSLNTLDAANVYQAQRLLNQSVWGREVLHSINNMGMKGNLLIKIDSPIRSAKVYMNDLIQHLDYTRKENERILKKHKFSDIFG